MDYGRYEGVVLVLRVLLRFIVRRSVGLLLGGRSTGTSMSRHTTIVYSTTRKMIRLLNCLGRGG